MAENNILIDREANTFIGGETCGCACRYENQGGVCTAHNTYANSKGGPTTTKGTSIEIEKW